MAAANQLSTSERLASIQAAASARSMALVYSASAAMRAFWSAMSSSRILRHFEQTSLIRCSRLQGPVRVGDIRRGDIAFGSTHRGFVSWTMGDAGDPRTLIGSESGFFGV
jgi:hypothetical protein